MVNARTRSAICATGWFLAVVGWAMYGLVVLALVTGCSSAPTKAQCAEAVKDCPTGSCVVVTDSGPIHVYEGRCA